MAKRGIDISAHQGDINLSALKDQIDFVIIRVGYGTKGTLDAKFRRNADLCIQLGIPFGFYWYSYALNESGAEAEANAFLNAVAPYKDKYSYGCWFDMEDADGYKKRNGMPSNGTLRAICAKFCSIVESAGYYVGIYASQSWFNNQLSGDELNRYDKWVAQWPTSGGKQKGLDTDPNSRTGLTLWQFTSDGIFNGYNGRLDSNYAYRDYPSLIGNLNEGNVPQPQPSAPTGTTLELAEKVMLGEFGDGEARKNALGSRYDEVQDFINYIASASIDTLVAETKAGKYGNGDIRKIVLGSRYNAVQDKINAGSVKSINAGSRVRVKQSASKYCTGQTIPGFVKGNIYSVIQVGTTAYPNGILLSGIMSWINKSDVDVL